MITTCVCVCVMCGCVYGRLTSAVLIVNVHQDFIARPQATPTLSAHPVREEQGVAVETTCVVLETSVVTVSKERLL